MDQASERQALLQATRDHLATLPSGATVTPTDLQRDLRLGWNTACSLLEHLEKDGELARVGLSTLLQFMRPSGPLPAGSVDPGYALPLSKKEHAVLMNAIEHILWLEPASKEDREAQKVLRAIRSRMKRPA